MRWLLLLVLPAALISWKQSPAKYTGTATTTKQFIDNDGDTLKLDDLIFSDFFSPNGDGFNDTYMILNVETYPSNNSLKVYNRWGEVVYLASPYNNDWNGFGNRGGAKELPDGVYYFEFYNGKGNKANGKITIKR
jgi:gliding motility-associated-like protein